MHECGSFPAETDGNPHPELHRRLAHFGPVGGRASISQIRASQLLRLPRTQGQFYQERAVPQPMNLVPGNSYQFSLNECGSHARTCTGHSAFIQKRLHSNSELIQTLKAFQRILGLMASVSSVLQLGLLHMRPAPSVLAETLSSSTRLVLWTHPSQGKPGLRYSSGPLEEHQWMEGGVPLGMVCRKKVVSADASSLGWGAL